MLMKLMMMMSGLKKIPWIQTGIKTKAVEGEKKGWRENLALTTEAGSMWSPVCWLVGFEATGFCQEAYCDSWPASQPAGQSAQARLVLLILVTCTGGWELLEKGCTASTCFCDTVGHAAPLPHVVWISSCSIWTPSQIMRQSTGCKAAWEPRRTSRRRGEETLFDTPGGVVQREGLYQPPPFSHLQKPEWLQTCLRFSMWRSVLCYSNSFRGKFCCLRDANISAVTRVWRLPCPRGQETARAALQW